MVDPIPLPIGQRPPSDFDRLCAPVHQYHELVIGSGASHFKVRP